MKNTSVTVAAGLVVAFASASHAQIGGVPSTYIVGWSSSYTGCSVGTTILTLPGGGTYFLPSPAPGGVNVGICLYGPPTIGVNVPTGWIGFGYSPPPASYFSYGKDESPANDENSNDEPPTPNPHLVNSSDIQDPPGGSGGGGNHDVVHEFAPVIPATTTTPEPASLLLVGSGLAGLAGLAWRRRKR